MISLMQAKIQALRSELLGIQPKIKEMVSEIA
jgi:hypothetical protein